MRPLPLLLLATLLLSACAERHDAGHAAWSYQGSAGPDHWATLSADFAACAGDMQSPIDLAGASPAWLPPLQFEAAASLAGVRDTGHSIQVDVPAGALTVGGDRYELAQLHFHTPSEHTVRGTAYPAEIHFVHRDADGRLAVVGVFVVEADENAAFAHLEPHLPGASMDGEPLEFRPHDLLPPDLAYQTYDGSLTTPPCTEGVRWIVLSAPIALSGRQIALLEAFHPDNARPVQASAVQLKRSIE